MSLTFRNAIALNNMGVLLLSRRCYIQAFDTLNDAIMLLKFSSQQHEDGCSLQGFEIESRSIESRSIEKHHLALQRISQPESCENHDTALFEIFRTSEIALEPHPSSSESTVFPSFTPIRIDEIDFSYRSNDSIEIECGIVLYNFAIAHFCMWQSKTSLRSSPCVSHYECALRLLKISHNLYSKEIYEKGTDMLISHPEILRIKIVILKTLVGFLAYSKHSRHQTAAESYCSILKNVQTTANEISKAHFALFGEQVTTAPAA
jgi:hypothetical protein